MCDDCCDAALERALLLCRAASDRMTHNVTASDSESQFWVTEGGENPRGVLTAFGGIILPLDTVSQVVKHEAKSICVLL